MYKELKYFKAKEFACKCGCSPEAKEMSMKLLLRLDKMREIVGRPININSGYRCKSHNRKVGGVKGSSHEKGLAADIEVKSDYERWQIIEATRKVGIIRIGISKNFIHVDIDYSKTSPRIWMY